MWYYQLSLIRCCASGVIGIVIRIFQTWRFKMIAIRIIKPMLFTFVLLIFGCVLPKQQLEVQNNLDIMQNRINAQQKLSNRTARQLGKLKKENQALLKRIETLEKELMEITFAIYDVIQKDENKGE